MPSIVSTTVTPAPLTKSISSSTGGPPRLEERFAALKRDIIKPEYEAAVIASYKRLKIALAAEADRIATAQQAAVPECAWSDVVANGKYIFILLLLIQLYGMLILCRREDSI